MADHATDLARRIMAGGNLSDILQSWAAEVAAEAPSTKKGGK